MTLKDLLNSFKGVATPKNSKFCDAFSCNLIYPLLLDMNIEEQINLIKSAPIFQNAFIDLINHELIPRATIDHQAGTVLPFDKDSKYPNGKNQKYTIIRNYRYIDKELEEFYRIRDYGAEEYSDQFNGLLLRYAYYNKIHYDYDDYSYDPELMTSICNYIVRKMWAGEDNGNKLKEKLKEMFYSGLEDSIDYLEDCKYDYLSIDELKESNDDHIVPFFNMADKLGIKEFKVSDYGKIRTVFQNHINQNIDKLVKALSSYTLSDLYKNKEDGVFILNLIEYTNIIVKDSKKAVKALIRSGKFANVDFYFQKEEYTKTEFFDLYMEPRPYVNVHSMIGKPDHFAKVNVQNALYSAIQKGDCTTNMFEVDPLAAH
jgi:hypothetical protein